MATASDDPVLQDFNVVFGSPAELEQREQHRALLSTLTPEEAESQIMLLNVCYAAERVRGGILEFNAVIDGNEAVLNLPWYKPYRYTENDMDMLRADGGSDGKAFGFFVGSTEKLQYDTSTVLDPDGGSWRMASHSSLRMRTGKFYDFGMVRDAGVTLELSPPLWTLYAIFEVLWMRLTIMFQAQVAVHELTPHSETNIFDLSLLTREFIELVVLSREGGGTVFASQNGSINITGVSLNIAPDGQSVSITLSSGLEKDQFTSWYCGFLEEILDQLDMRNLNQKLSDEGAETLAQIDSNTSEAEKLRRLMIVHQTSGDDEKWRAIQAVVILKYMRSSEGATLTNQIEGQLRSDGKNFASAMTDELEDVLEEVLPGIDVEDLANLCEVRLRVGIMHMANYRYRSVSENRRIAGAWFGPGRGIELSMPQENTIRIKIKGEKFVLRLEEDGLLAERDGLYAKLVRVLNQLPEISVLDTGIGRPQLTNRCINSAWLVNLILAGKAGEDKAIWVLRAIYNGLIDVNSRSRRAGYIPNCFKGEKGLRIEQHLSSRVAVKLCYITDGKNVFLVKDHEATDAVALTRKSPSSMQGQDFELSHRPGEHRYESVALLSKCKLC